jgi:hypothetical protein
MPRRATASGRSCLSCWRCCRPPRAGGSRRSAPASHGPCSRRSWARPTARGSGSAAAIRDRARASHAARLAKLLAGAGDDVLDGLLDAVWEQRLEPELAHLAALLPARGLTAFAERLATRAGDELVDGLREVAEELDLDALSGVLRCP